MFDVLNLYTLHFEHFVLATVYSPPKVSNEVCPYKFAIVNIQF